LGKLTRGTRIAWQVIGLIYLNLQPMQIYPESADVQLEFDKVKTLLQGYCKTHYSKQKAEELRIHTHKSYITLELQQTHEFKQIMLHGLQLPNDYVIDASRHIKLVSIPGSMLSAEELVALRKLLENTENIFRWFDKERRLAYPALERVIEQLHYEKQIKALIDDVLDEAGLVKDNASEDLQHIRLSLYRKRNELRRAFEKVVARLSRAGYTADIDESFSNGRRVVAVFSEYKRQVKGILHGESDSRRTAYIEPEETIDLNNEVYEYEMEEQREVTRILRLLTAMLQPYAGLLRSYLLIAGLFDFIAAKAKLALSMNANLPNIEDKAVVDLKEAYHPLLYLYNKKNNKATMPVNLQLDDSQRILIISGPNAGGKTVTMKTVGLNQMMMQSGLLVPVNPTSTMGIFKKLFIHIGDTQSIEFELSTYSAHLTHLKHFIEEANGRTMFFIDELGSGSDPNLGGAFAEVIMEELLRRHSIGIVTTHYLNLKVMGSKTAGIVNGAMMFDEQNLLPMYRLTVGKPGSSYTFSIAERIGLPRHMINRARKLVDEDHFKLDKLLNRTEQDLQHIQKEKQELAQLVKENTRLKKEMEVLMNKERHQQQVELLKQQNRITEERLQYLRDMDRRLRHIVIEWRKAEDKNEVVKEINQLLFPAKEKVVTNKLSKKIDARFELTGETIGVGTIVRVTKNHQVGEVLELRGKKAVVKIGSLPMTLDMKDLVAVKEKNVVL
jgi:DNA mismatch repair protein MutS2